MPELGNGVTLALMERPLMPLIAGPADQWTSLSRRSGSVNYVDVC
jgi:hypothetical protein